MPEIRVFITKIPKINLNNYYKSERKYDFKKRKNVG